MEEQPEEEATLHNYMFIFSAYKPPQPPPCSRERLKVIL
jgi:hypothetical protein